MKRVGVLDYGLGNLRSVSLALVRLGAVVTVSDDWHQLELCDGLVLPGVGAFAACMAGLANGGHQDRLGEWVKTDRPLLGICVGHQVLFSRGVEHGVTTAGLGILSGDVEQLTAKRLPHMGWDTIEAPPGSAMFEGVANERFYFVHSYAVIAPARDLSVALCRYESDSFVAAVEHGNIWSTQFHPEKSGTPGAGLLANWLRIVC